MSIDPAQMEQDAAVEEAEASDFEGLAQLGHELETLKEELDRLNAEKKIVQERYDALRKSIIPDVMHSVGVARDGRGSFTTTTGARISLRNDLYAGYRKEDEERVFEWLEREGNADVIKRTVHNGTFRALIRERIAEGKPTPEELVNQYYETSVTLTRPRRK